MLSPADVVIFSTEDIRAALLEAGIESASQRLSALMPSVNMALSTALCEADGREFAAYVALELERFGDEDVTPKDRSDAALYVQYAVRGLDVDGALDQASVGVFDRIAELLRALRLSDLEVSRALCSLKTPALV